MSGSKSVLTILILESPSDKALRLDEISNGLSVDSKEGRSLDRALGYSNI